MMESVKSWCCWRLAMCHLLLPSGVPHIHLSLFALLIAKTTCHIHRLNDPWFWSWDEKFFFKFRVAFSASKGTQLQNTYLWYSVEFSWRNDMNIFLISATIKGNKSIYIISFTLPPCSTAFINYFISSTEIQLDSDNSRMSWVNHWCYCFKLSIFQGARAIRKKSVVTVLGITALPLW